jgi:hypothetical protein
MKLSEKAKELAEKSALEKRGPLSPDHIVNLLRKQRYTTKQLCQKLLASEKEIMTMIRVMQDRGILVYLFGDEWGVEKAPPAGTDDHVYLSRPDGTYLFGFSSDEHLGSKYSRLDVLEDLYDRFAEQGVDRVIGSGNWIDGEARFNKHDLLVHGMDQQIEYMIDNLPKRDGIVTYAVAGDDHEGWYGQREGVDIGKHAEQLMRASGRDDWVNLGYMESFVELRHAKTGKSCQLLVMHPGGGSAYAMSYKPQKIVESFEGGEKPSALLIGHYHKMSYQLTRNVHAIQCGTTQDQTPFMRKKGIQAHVGGGICQLRQDADTGALTACRVEFFNYFNQSYYNGRWSNGGKVTLADRGVGKKK